MHTIIALHNIQSFVALCNSLLLLLTRFVVFAVLILLSIHSRHPGEILKCGTRSFWGSRALCITKISVVDPNLLKKTFFVAPKVCSSYSHFCPNLMLIKIKHDRGNLILPGVASNLILVPLNPSVNVLYNIRFIP